MERSHWRWLVACLLVALGLRLGFVFFGFPYLQQRWNLREDGDGYGFIAQTIRDGNYRDVTRGPVYPLFVAVASSPLSVKLLQAFLDTAVCALVFALSQRATFGGGLARGGLWAAWSWALYPFAIWRVAFINKEVVLTFLLVSYACAQLWAFRDKRLWPWLAAGMLLGVVNLCKPTFLLWPIVVLLFVGRFRVPMQRFLLLLAAMAVVIVPWSARNYWVSHGEFLPVATEQGGMTTFVGNYQPTLGLWEGPWKKRWQDAVEEIKRQNPDATVVQLDRAFYRAAWEQAISNPWKAVELFVRKIGRFWFFSAARREQMISLCVQLVCLSAAAWALWRDRAQQDGWKAVLVTLILYTNLVHAMSYADMRFSLPVMPFVCVLAARAFERDAPSRVTWKPWRKRGESSAGAG
jgi:hypothetical protein